MAADLKGLILRFRVSELFASRDKVLVEDKTKTQSSNSIICVMVGKMII